MGNFDLGKNPSKKINGGNTSTVIATGFKAYLLNGMPILLVLLLLPICYIEYHY